MFVSGCVKNRALRALSFKLSVLRLQRIRKFTGRASSFGNGFAGCVRLTVLVRNKTSVPHYEVKQRAKLCLITLDLFHLDLHSLPNNMISLILVWFLRGDTF